MSGDKMSTNINSKSDDQSRDQLSLSQASLNQAEQPGKSAQPTLELAACREFVENIAISIATLRSGRWRKEAHYQEARGEVLKGYFTPGTSAHFLVELAKLKAFSAPRAPVLLEVFERFRRLDFEDQVVTQAQEHEELRAIETLQVEAFEDESITLLKSSPEVDQHIMFLSNEVFALLQQTDCYKNLCLEYEKPHDQQSSQVISSELEKVSALFLTSFMYIRVTLDQHKALNDEPSSAFLVNQLIAVSCSVNLLKKFPNHEMATAVVNKATEVCYERFTPKYCQVASDTFVYCAVRIKRTSEILAGVTHAFIGTSVFNSIMRAVSLFDIPETGDVPYPHIGGLIRLILRIEGEQDNFLAFNKLGRDALGFFSVVKARARFDEIEQAAVPSDTHAVLLESSFGLRDDMSVIPSMSAAFSPICGADDLGAQQLVRLRAYLYTVISDLSRREPELFRSLQPDCKFTIFINKTNIMIMPPRKLQELGPLIFDEKYIGVPLSQTDLSLITVGPSEDLVYVLPIEEPSGQEEEEDDYEQSAPEENEGDVVQPNQEGRDYRAEARKVIRKGYPNFQALLKVLKKQGAEVNVSRGKGSHALIQREGKVALVSKKVYDETSRLKHRIAISIIEDLGFSCEDALDWL